MRERAARVAEPDGREPRLGLGARELEAAGGQRRHRGEERTIEQPLVKSAHTLPRGVPERRQLVGTACEPGGARERAQPALVAWHQVGAPQALELQSVLEDPEDPVVASELG